MNAAREQHFRDLLRRLKTEGERPDEVAEDARKTVTLDQASVGRLSRMDALQGQQMALAAQRRKQAMLSRVDSALARLERGEYGQCLECDEPIAEARLEFDPTTLFCLECANARETRPAKHDQRK